MTWLGPGILPGAVRTLAIAALVTSCLTALSACDLGQGHFRPRDTSVILVYLKQGVSRQAATAELKRCHPLSVSVFRAPSRRSDSEYIVEAPPVQTSRASALFKCIKSAPDVTHQMWQDFS